MHWCSSGAKPVGSDAFERYRIARGVPRYGLDLRERDLPQETGQEHALNSSKGCYIGQEIVERIRARGNVHRTLIGFEVQGEPPQRGTKIRANDKDVGEITSATRVARKRAHNRSRIFAAGSRRAGNSGAGRRAERHGREPSLSVLNGSKTMADKEKKQEFVVTDRRLFSTDGELRQDVVEAEELREEREREKREAQQRANEERAAQNHTPEPSTPTPSPAPVEPEAEMPSAQRATGLRSRISAIHA